MKQPVFIRIYDGKNLVSVKQFTEPQIVVGNQGQVQLNLIDPNISQIHAMIEERDGGYHVCDLGSVSGTFLNDKQILDEKINSGDVLKLGRFSLEFYIGIPKPIAKPVSNETIVSDADHKKDLEDESTKVISAPIVPPSNMSRPIPPKVEEVKEEEIKLEENKIEEFKVERVEIPKVVPNIVTGGQSASASQGGLSEYEPVKRRATFAPKSSYKSLDEVIQPSKGTLVEVLVTWGDRVLTTYHCNKRTLVRVGSHPKNEIILPTLSSDMSSVPLLKVGDSEVKFFIHPSFKGQLYQNGKKISFDDLDYQGKVHAVGNRKAYSLMQGEMIRADLGEGISLYIRYVSPSPKPLMIPFLGFTSTEVTALAISLIIGALIYLLSSIKEEVFEPIPQEEIKVTRFIFTEKHSPPPTPTPRPTATPRPRPTPTPPPARVREQADRTAPLVRPRQEQATQSGAAAEARPNESTSRRVQPTADRQAPSDNMRVDSGGVQADTSVNAGTTPQQDVRQTGLLGAFARSGAQSQLAKTNQGAGAIAGLSQSVTGEAGSGGDGPVSEGLREVGRGGQGTARIGVADVGTRGRGGGTEGYGSGTLGERQSSEIRIEQAELASDGSIDREAILRVLRNNLSQVQACYQQELNRNQNLHGEVRVTWDIGAGGRVTAIRISESTLNDRSVENCIMTRFRAWRFPEPPPNQVAEVNYRYVFTAK